MRAFITWMIRRRNPAFTPDRALSNRDYFLFAWRQLIGLLRGSRLVLCGRRPRGLLLGHGVRMSFLSKICWGRFVRLGEHVFMSALGREGISLGDGVSIGAYSRVIVSTTASDPGQFIRIGNHVGIGEFAYLGGAGGLVIGDDCIIGQYFSCHPENHCFDDIQLPIRLQGVTRKGIVIGPNCWIGSKVTILDGVEIGAGCVIAAGAVVTRSVPSRSLIGGVPATVKKVIA